MESIEVGSYLRPYEYKEAVRKASYWDVVGAAQVVLFIALAVFFIGFIAGSEVNDKLSRWSGTVVAK